ncbi:Uncharacterized protein APZ42_023731 [Daphnia magna]|uniref:Uncharacterized protein n=1 Tax=Daphnia magna TaxID=35525 RepID=A0A164UQZ0_9CRUS|nr:Uncharacterized protein APZ42_023731 [Daphnia magna]
MGLFTREYRLSLLLLSYTAHSAHFFFHVISIFYNRFRRENMNVYYVKIVHARARETGERNISFFFSLFPRPSSLWAVDRIGCLSI